jgi:bacterioferritin-associated ferredoxin
MFVCSCAGVTDHRIRELAENGSVNTFKELCDLTCIAKGCGICARTAKKIYDQAAPATRS